MPNIIYQYQNGFQELNIRTYVKYGNFTVGYAGTQTEMHYSLFVLQINLSLGIAMILPFLS